MTELITTREPLPALMPEEETFYRELGERLAGFRRARGLTQVQLAEQLGISQQHLLSLEKGRRRMLAGTLPALCEALGVSIEDLMQSQATKPSRRGPTSRIQQQLERIKQLPRSKQRFVLEMLDTVLQQNGR